MPRHVTLRHLLLQVQRDGERCCADGTSACYTQTTEYVATRARTRARARARARKRARDRTRARMRACARGVCVVRVVHPPAAVSCAPCDAISSAGQRPRHGVAGSRSHARWRHNEKDATNGHGTRQLERESSTTPLSPPPKPRGWEKKKRTCGGPSRRNPPLLPPKTGVPSPRAAPAASRGTHDSYMTVTLLLQHPPPLLARYALCGGSVEATGYCVMPCTDVAYFTPDATYSAQCENTWDIDDDACEEVR